ncbi:hypothetical protein ARMGADRAFT_1014688 [Armillaria gallica]|uniref:Uncharacterized protein n=1 Tax=Armillaria gallica TaxID=47427 RepID=A0A2H3D423_ARMGA|nr:hypothetical protein ARMGADRAFT_1014688 [Armillaria gallica]
MTTKSQPFSRLSRFGVSFKSNPSSRNRNPGKTAAEDDNWYIPYNGPVEAPRRPYAKPKERDSWGDSVYDDGEGVAQNGWDRGRPRAHTEPGRNGSSDASHRPRQPTRSYVNVDPSGGVGESPAPRISRESTPKSPFASIFSFGSPKKRAPPPSVSTKSDFKRGRRDDRESNGDDEDYYNSYYSSLVQSPLRNQYQSRPEDSRHSPSSPIGRSEHTHSPASGQSSSSIPHPYAYVFPTGDYNDAPKTAPLMSMNSRDYDPFQRIPVHPSQSAGNGQRSSLHPSSAAGHRLTNSISSPDLRLSPASSSSRTQPKSSILKGKERWLSPETWCDALFLPKPRFKVKQDGSIQYGKGRIVSPPGSPVFTSFGQANQPPGVLSRALAQSRSMVDLPRTADLSHRHAPEPFYIGQAQPPASGNAEAGPSRPPRPRSLSLDDLALPSPVPSLARVLEEGQILDHQRKKWQMQAQSSFQNSRARSLSRARTKSLNSKQAKLVETGTVKHPHIDFLAARSLLGNQDPMNISTKARLRTASQPSGSGGPTFSRSSHTHSNSLSKASKSSKSHSQGHSRNESWGKKVAKTTGGALCGFDASALTPTEEKKLPFDDALAGDGTRVIRFEDPPTVRDSIVRLTPSQGPSPTPSAGSDLRMGIALSTPPTDIEDRESIRLPAHPYAQGGRYAYTSPSRGSDYAGPHPSSVAGGDPERLDVSQRHRLPPRALNHPYAQYADRDSYSDNDRIIPNPRPDSNISPASKMWAQLSPNGKVHEILPEEIRYSPVVHAKGAGANIRHSGNIFDTIGLGEALFSAGEARGSKDSGLGASEEQGVRGQANGILHPYSNFRQPVAYDVTRPLYFYKPVAEKPLPPQPGDDDVSATSTPQRPALVHESSSSTERTPETNSSQASPRPLGSPDDLEHFQDLFYRPSQVIGPALSRNPSSRSGLTTLANQLNHEFGERDRHLSGGSSSGSSRPGGDGMQFVLSERPEGARRGSIIPPFHPSVTIPEDVESSRASSVIERSPVEAASDEAFKLGQVESQATPPAVSSAHRSSFIGLMAFSPGRGPPEEEDPDNTVTIRDSRALLHPSISGLPSSDLTRSSYLTNSSLYSRMSNLSDFPVPPARDAPPRVSYTSPYFDDQYTTRDARSVTSSKRMTFGGDEEIDQLLASLSTS